MYRTARSRDDDHCDHHVNTLHQSSLLLFVDELCFLPDFLHTVNPARVVIQKTIIINLDVYQSKNKLFSKNVHSLGIEPRLLAPQANVLSIERRVRENKIARKVYPAGTKKSIEACELILSNSLLQTRQLVN